MTDSKKSGFTLIELLVAIAIVGLLSSLAVVSFSNVQKKSRNAKRMSDINQYKTAFALAFNANGEYPNPGDEDYRCLGKYDDNICWDGTVPVNNNAENIIKSYFPAMPTDSIPFAGYMLEPYIFRCILENSNCTKAIIRWGLEGVSQSCGNGAEVFSGSFSPFGLTLCEETLQ